MAGGERARYPVSALAALLPASGAGTARLLVED